MRKGTSLGTKWTIRYSAATLIAFSLLGFLLLDRIEAALRRDATLILELELAELLAELRQRRNESTHDLAKLIEPELAATEPDLRIGFQVFDHHGRVRYGHGPLHERAVGAPREILAPSSGRVFRELDLGEDHPYWVLASNAGEDGAVQVSLSARLFLRSLHSIQSAFLATFPIAIAVAAALAFFLARGSLRPVREIVSAARGIKGDQPDAAIPTTGSGDELDQIAAEFNDLLARIHRSMETLRRFSMDAAHQLRSPVTALRSRIEVTLEASRVSKETEGVLRDLLEDTTLLGETVDAMVRLSRSGAGVDPDRRAPVNLGRLLEAVVEFFAPMAAGQNVSISLGAPEEAIVSGDETWLRQLFVNLLENALRYTGEGGKIDVTLSRQDGRAAVRVIDNGRGIPASQLDLVFEAFHRSDPRPETPGLGLGLTIARQIAVAHGGAIRVESHPRRGSTFTVALPLDR